MRNPAILFVILWLVPAVNTLAQPRLDSVFHRLQVSSTPEAVAYLNKTLSPKDSLWNYISNNIEERSSSIPAANLSVLYVYLGDYLIEHKDLKKGYRFLREGQRLAHQSKGFSLLIFYYRYSMVFKKMSRLDSAIYYGRKMLDLSRELKHDSLETEALKQVGYLYYDVNEYRQSISCFRQIASKTSRNVEKRNAYNTIGLCFRNSGIYDSALIYFKPSLELSATDTLYLGLVYGNIGDTYYLQRRYHEALPYLLTELNYTSRHGISKIALDCMNTLAELYLHIDNVGMAKVYYDSLGRYINGIHAGPSVKQNYFRLSAEYQKRKGDYKKAMESLAQYYHFKDSLSVLRNSQLAAQVSAQYDFDAQRKEIESLHQLARIQEAENKQKSFFLMAALAILLLILALLFVVYTNYQQKKESYHLVQQHSSYVEQVNEELRVNMEKMEEKNKQIFDMAGHLQEVNSSKDKLFSIISHDLRNPIQSLKGLLSLVASQSISQQEFVQFSGKLKDGVGHIEFTMNNLLQWARSQMHGFQTNRQQVHLQQLAQESINFLRDNAHNKSIELINTIEGDIHVYADKDQVNLVIRNLTSNAIKFTRENGKVVLSAKVNADKSVVTFSIKDNGTGMDEDTLNSLFIDGYGQTTQGTHGEKGSGLGLRLCKEMVENNKGRLWVESIHGKGSTFFIALPVNNNHEY